MDIRGIGATCVAALVVCVPLMASGAGVDSVPAETPPSNFTGMQYVDSKGCAFIRVGFSGPARWVPRVTRQRRQVCGLAPSLSSNERTQVAASQAPASGTPVEITFDDPVVVPTPRAAAPKPRAQEGASLGTALASLFRPKRQAQPVLRAAPEPMRTTVTDPIRVQPTTKVIRPSGGEIKIPAGYKVACNDDRLNPNRGIQKVSGMIQTTKHWTNTVPRKHRNVATDQERAAWSMLVYPFKSRDDLLNYVNSMDDLDLDVKTNGAIEMSPAHEGEVTARVSTRNIMPKTAKTLGLAGRYIQVGAYGRTANADRAHKRLAQVGLPVEHRVVNRNGSQLNLILAGPFSDVAQLRGALDRARDAGFSDAYVK